jgi:hypothetical protein
MLSPCEIVRIDSAGASLLCAVTPVRRILVSTVQKDAKRDSFSRGICSTDTDFSRFWHGLEQTAFQSASPQIAASWAAREKTFRHDCEGTDTLMRRTILVKSIPIKSVWNQAVWPENADKPDLFC